MTDFQTLTSNDKDSASKQAASVTHEHCRQANVGLSTAAARHADFEIASFHTPGHKGRALTPGFARLQERFLRLDLTELPGLDDLSDPDGFISQLELKCSSLWQSGKTLISVAGASAGMMATLLALSATNKRKKILVPRNLHRSAVNGLILSGLEPIWYEPVWDSHWSVWGQVTATWMEKTLESVDIGECCAVVVVSPTYPGAVSDVEDISRKCRAVGVALIVDEAHGAHLLPGSALPSAVPFADVTIHSLHKTLSGFTQTGLIHVRANGRIHSDAIRTAMNLIHSSSPSYPLMISIEETVTLLQSPAGAGFLARLNALSSELRERLRDLPDFEVYTSHFAVDAPHILIRHRYSSADHLAQFLQQQRIFPEAVLGHGVLLLLGLGSQQEDLDALLHALKQYAAGVEPQNWAPPPPAPPACLGAEQIMTPRQASQMPSEVVPVQDAVGRIAAECVAPCPPGIPVSIPGQRVHSEVMNIPSLRKLKVVKLDVSPTE